jgi:hypothetical protein
MKFLCVFTWILSSARPRTHWILVFGPDTANRYNRGVKVQNMESEDIKHGLGLSGFSWVASEANPNLPKPLISHL